MRSFKQRQRGLGLNLSGTAHQNRRRRPGTGRPVVGSTSTLWGGTLVGAPPTGFTSQLPVRLAGPLPHVMHVLMLLSSSSQTDAAPMFVPRKQTHITSHTRALKNLCKVLLVEFWSP